MRKFDTPSQTVDSGDRAGSPCSRSSWCFLILGVISYFVATRLFTDEASRHAEMDLVKNHLRYAQSRAMNTETNWGINFDTVEQYCLFNGPIRVLIRLPGVRNVRRHGRRFAALQLRTLPAGGNL